MTDPGASHGDPGPAPGHGGSVAHEWVGAVYVGPRTAFVRRHRYVVTLIVLAVSVCTCVALFLIAGWSAVAARFHHLLWWFLPLTLLAHLCAYAGYLIGHHEVVNRSRKTPVSWRRGAEIAVIGFGGWLPGGGFAVDRHALETAGLSRRNANASAILLGLLELLVLAPAAWLCALFLLGSDIPDSVTLPWIILVPVGFLLAFGAIPVRSPARSAPAGPLLRGIGQLGAGTRAGLALLRRPHRGALAIAGIAAYWAADIVALWAAMRFVSANVAPDRLILAYATGYVLTRRTLPFAGVVIIEALLTVALLTVHVPIASAALAVFVYRLSDFGLTLGAALLTSSAVDRELTFMVTPPPAPLPQPAPADRTRRLGTEPAA